MYQDIYNCICQNTKNEDILSIMSNLQHNCCFKNWFPKGGPTCRRQVVNPRHQTPQGQSVAKPETPHAEYPSRVARCDIKGSDCTMLNPIVSFNDFLPKHLSSKQTVYLNPYLAISCSCGTRACSYRIADFRILGYMTISAPSHAAAWIQGIYLLPVLLLITIETGAAVRRTCVHTYLHTR